ncbi:hypothetical protein LTR84_001520 [Exophiala bonariae]|uniref:Antigenic thaumatin-like protein n=1 Tax=Exophiala bonariae TaxID=1690606 RepID=A0AAV9NHC2_9EURO|nr:hypothetical protein LTR84_001520 [Exophiala bonariae]
MQFKNIISGAAVLLASTPAVMALGTATVINNCGYPIYYASVGQSYHANMQPLQGSYSEGYSQQGVGISIKLAPNATSSGPVSQFEFTWANGKIAYDLSNIDGYPFSAGGMQVVPSKQGDSANPTCVVVDCPAGQAVCTAAYNAPDDVRTMVCDENTSLTLTMCPGGSAKRSVEVKGQHIRYRVHARQFVTDEA